MSDEVTYRGSLSIRKLSGAITQMDYRSNPTTFLADLTGLKGPTLGCIAVATGGTDVDLSELTTPGFCFLYNQDDENYVEYGIWDGSTFWPLGELGPGEHNVLKLSRNLDLGVGTAYGSLRLKANTAACNVVVDVFER